MVWLTVHADYLASLSWWNKPTASTFLEQELNENVVTDEDTLVSIDYLQQKQEEEIYQLPFSLRSC